MQFFNLFRFISMPFFDADGGAGGGGGTTQTEPTEEEKKQADLNKQFADRAKRAADAKEKEILEALGVKDPEEAKALLKVARDTQDATKTETERLQAQITEAQTAKEKAEADAKTALALANTKLLNSEITVSAFTAVMEKDKVVRPAFRKEAKDDILLLIDRTGINEKDGKFEGVDKALTALAKAKPWLLEEKQQPTRGTPGEGGRRGKGESGNENRTPIISSL